MKKRLSILMLLAALVVPWASRAQSTLTVCDGTGTNTHYPVNGLYVDTYGTCNEFIIPASMLSDMEGATINSMTFYLSSSATLAWTGTIQIYLGETEATSVASFSTPSSSSVTVVYTGLLDATGSTMTVTFTNPYEYNGGNLLVGSFTSVAGNYTSATFQGMTQADYTARYRTSATGTGTQEKFIPKTTFSYVMGNVSCYAVKNLAISELTGESVTLSWTDTSNSSATYTVYAVSATDTTVIEDGITDTFYTVEDLNPTTDYTFAVAADCGAGDESSKRYISATTACMAVATDSLPWIYGFEDATGSGSAYAFNQCMGRYTDYSSTAYPYPSSTNKHSGTYGLYFYSTSSYYSHVTLPLFEEDLDQLQLSFWAYRTNTATYGHYIVGVMNDPSDLSTFDTLLVGQAPNSWEYVEVPLAGYTGTGRYLAILSPKMSAASYLYIDDIMVDYLPTCLRPTAVDTTAVTPNSATFSITHDDASTFMVLWHKVGNENWDTLDVEGNTFTLTGLTSGLSYEGRVYTICGSDTTMGYAKFSVTAGCAAITAADLPYSEDFETYESGSAYPINACWEKGLSVATSGTTTNFPYPYSTAAIHGIRGLYFYGAKTSSVGYGCWLALPRIDDELDVSDLMVNFNVKRSTSTSSSTSTYTCRLLLGVADSLTGFNQVSTIESHVTWIDTLDYSNAAASSIHAAEVNFSNYSGAGKYIVFYVPVPDNTTSSNYTHVYLDDIVLREIPSCYWPSEVVVDSVSTHEVTLTWTPDPRTPSPDSWTVEYGPVDFTAGEGNTVTSSDTTVTINNLNASTRYEFRVMANCSGTLSDWASTIATTDCEPLALPYYENFDSLSYLSNGDATDMTGGAPPCWNVIGNSGSYIALYSASTYRYGESGYSIKFKSGANNVPNYLVLPAFVNEISTLEMSFQTRPEGTSSSSGSFDVGYLTNAADASSFVVVQHYDYSDFSGAYEGRVVTFDNAPEGSRIAMRHIPTASGWFWFIDEIDVHVGPSCSRAQDFAIANVTDESIDVVIVDPNEVGNYVITLSNANDSVLGVFNTSDTNYTITGLTPQTVYNISMVTDCDDGTYTAPYTLNVRTACTAIPTDSLPYIEDFETYSTGSSATISPCWTKGVVGTTTQYPYPTATAATGSQSLYFYSYKPSSATTAPYINYAALPLFEAPLNTLRVKYKLRRYSSTTSNYTGVMAVGVMSDPTDLSTFDTIIVNDITNTPASSIHDFEVSLASYQGAGSYIAFMAPVPPLIGTSTYSYNYIYLDSVVVDLLPNCYRPDPVAVGDITASSVDLSWFGNASSYEVEYADNAAFNNSNVTVVNDTTATIDNLNDYTAYWFRVRGICGANDSSEWSVPVQAITLLDCGDNNVNIVDTIGDGTSSGYIYTFYGYTSYYQGYSSAIYTAQELNEMGLQTNNRINGISLHVGSTGGILRKAKIYMAESSLAQYGATAANDTLNRNNMTLVYSGDIVAEAGSWVDIVFDSAFTYSGNSNLRITFARDTIPSASVTFYYTTYANNYLNCYGYRSSSTTANLTATRSTYRPNIVFNICTEIPACARPTDVVSQDVVDTAMTLTWNGTAASYEVLVSTTSIDPNASTGHTSYTTATNSITITDLNPNTTYYYYVKSICSATEHSDWSIEGSVRTACAEENLPYVEDFENYASGSTSTISPCWTKGTNSTTAYPYPYSTNAINGQHSLYFYSYHPSSTSSTAYYCYAALPMMADSVNNLTMTFNVRTYSTASTYYYTYLLVGVMDNPNDISTFTAVDTINLHGEPALSVHGVEVDFANYTGTGKYIAIYDPVPPLIGGATYAYSYAYVDDVMVDVTPTCPRPTNVTVNNISQNTATVHWTHAATDFEIEYGPEGFAHGTGVTVTSTGNSVVLTGLTQGTDYEVYVRAICSATDQGPWSFATNFATACGMNTLPMVMDFEGYATGTSSPMPTCWLKWNNAASASYNYYPYINTGNAHSGTNNFYFYFSTSTSYPTDEMIITPEIDTIDFPMNTVEAVFWAKRNTNAIDLIVGVVQNVASPNTSFVPVDTIALTTTHTEYIVSFANYNGNGNRIAFRGIHTGSSAQYIYLDDIIIEQMSECERADSLTASNATQNSVVLQWRDTIGSTSWVVSYRPDTASTWTEITVTSNPYTLTGLTPFSRYEYRVAPICASGQRADWSRTTKFFRTAQVPATMPYSYDFEDAAEWQNWNTLTSVNSTSRTVNWYRGTAVAAAGNYSMYLSTDGGTTHSWDTTVVTNAVAFRDIDFGSVPHSYAIAFDALIGGATDAFYDGIIVFTVDPADDYEVSTAAIHTPWGNVNDMESIGGIRHNSVWTHHELYLDGVSGVKRLVFYHFNNAGSHQRIDMASAIDNLTITMQTCERPGDLAVSDETLNGATLTWVGDPAALYQVAYRLEGASANTNILDTVRGTSYVVTNAQSSSTYNWWVRKICTLTATDTNISGWTSSSSFTTLCGLTPLPYSEGFEGVTGAAYNVAGELPGCWDSYTNGTDDNYAAHVVNTGSYANYPHTGTSCLGMASGSTATFGNTKIAVLPPFVQPITNLHMRFWYRMENATSGMLTVGYVTNLNDMDGSFVPMKTISNTTTVTQDSVFFDSVQVANARIAFKWYQDGTWYTVGIDDIEVWSTNPGPACSHPENVVASGVTHNSATLSWTGNADNYEVAIMAGEWVEPNTGTAVANTSISYNNLIPGIAYNFGVRAVCGDALVSDWEVISFVTDVLPCYVPTNLTVTNVTYNSALATFTPGEGQTEWALHLMGQGVDRYDTINTNSVTITGLVHGNAYQVAVRAICNDTMSAWSDTANFSTLSCDIPQNVTVTEVTGTTARVSWTATGAASYIVSYGYQGGSQSEGTQITVSTNSVVLTGLETETSYDVYVRSLCADGIMSVWSTAANFTTTAGSGPEPTYYTITVLANNNDWGTVSGGGSFLENTTTTISATANQGYRFVQWQDGNTDNPRTITVTADMTYTATFADGVGIDEVSLDEVSLYPNPATSTVTVRANGMEQVSIIDLNGRTVMTQRVNTETATFDLSTLAKGTYFVRIVGEQAAAVRKLVVK